MNKGKFFRENLLNWYHPDSRPLPWKETKDPFKIWLSEIILQQTRVEQGLPYYLAFTQKYADVNGLASAPIDEIYKLWEGLGYYSRARNMHAAANQIVNNFSGLFPDNYEDIISLKGIGKYTAAAISSFAFNLSHAVVDGNVYRLLSRVFGIAEAIDSTEGKKKFEKLANELICNKNPGKYNQAIMDFGATVCKPRNPLCLNCPFEKICLARNTEKIGFFPVKNKKIKKRKRYFAFLIIRNKKEIFLEKRTGKDIWSNLYTYPLIESERDLSETELEENIKKLVPEGNINKVNFVSTEKQLLTHQEIIARFFEVKFEKLPPTILNRYEVASQTQLKNYTFPVIIRKFKKKFQDKIL